MEYRREDELLSSMCRGTQSWASLRSPDSDLLTRVLQVNEVQGLQIRGRGDGRWVPVKPAEGALVVNVGDIFEIFTNGRYSSIEHRAVINMEKERLSVAAFHSPSVHATIGPLREVMDMVKRRCIRRWIMKAS